MLHAQTQTQTVGQVRLSSTDSVFQHWRCRSAQTLHCSVCPGPVCSGRAHSFNFSSVIFLLTAEWRLKVHVGKRKWCHENEFDVKLCETERLESNGCLKENDTHSEKLENRFFFLRGWDILVLFICLQLRPSDFLFLTFGKKNCNLFVMSRHYAGKPFFTGLWFICFFIVCLFHSRDCY